MAIFKKYLDATVAQWSARQQKILRSHVQNEKTGRKYLVSNSQSYLVEGDEGCISPSGKLLCLLQPQMQHMHCNITYLFDFWADPVENLLLLKMLYEQFYQKISFISNLSHIFRFQAGHNFLQDTISSLVVFVMKNIQHVKMAQLICLCIISRFQVETDF